MAKQAILFLTKIKISNGTCYHGFETAGFFAYKFNPKLIVAYLMK